MKKVYLVYCIDDCSTQMVFSNEAAAKKYCDLHNASVSKDHWWNQVSYFSVPVFKEFTGND